MFNNRLSMTACLWLCLISQLLALWPQGQWIAARMQDGSDQPFGVIAVLSLAALLITQQSAWQAPKTRFLLMAVVLQLAACGAWLMLPPLLSSLLAVLAISMLIAAFLPQNSPYLPIFGLAVLSLPLLSSLQFYAGFPLRVITAQCSAWILQLWGNQVERIGTNLQINGQLVMVDAPCSGVQLAWMVYFFACVIALYRQIADKHFLRCWPLLGVLVLLGNIIRNTCLVVLETRPQGLSDSLHQSIGLVILVMVCSVVAWLLSKQPTPEKQEKSMVLASPAWLFPLVMLCMMLSGAVSWSKQSATTQTNPKYIEWPQQWDGKPLQPLALSVVENRFAANFAGHIGRFSDGQRQIVLRYVEQPTRMLHPASDCYKGLGYHIQHEQLEYDDQQRVWRCFYATKQGQIVRVCERIVDKQGKVFTDTSSWYWQAELGHSQGVWWAITTAEVVAMVAER